MNYEVGQPVICYEDDASQTNIIGFITKFRGNDWYEIEWCDGEVDIYPEHNVAMYVNIYNKIKEESR